jgi:hypothetical protein
MEMPRFSEIQQTSPPSHKNGKKIIHFVLFRVLPENLIVTELVKKYLASYGS